MSHSVTLNWDKSPAGQTVTSYNVKRATVSGGPFTTIGTVANTGTANTFVDTTGLVEGSTLFYEVTAVNTAGESAASGVISVTVPFSVPDAPTGLVGKAV